VPAEAAAGSLRRRAAGAAARGAAALASPRGAAAGRIPCGPPAPRRRPRDRPLDRQANAAPLLLDVHDLDGDVGPDREARLEAGDRSPHRSTRAGPYRRDPGRARRRSRTPRPWRPSRSAWYPARGKRPEEGLPSGERGDDRDAAARPIHGDDDPVVAPLDVEPVAPARRPSAGTRARERALRSRASAPRTRRSPRSASAFRGTPCRPRRARAPTPTGR
jgi:hypothetical protein